MRFISDKLKVTEMGPADHIRTKHEVKLLVDADERLVAEELVRRAQAHRNLAQTVTIRTSEQQSRGISQE